MWYNSFVEGSPGLFVYHKAPLLFCFKRPLPSTRTVNRQNDNGVLCLRDEMTSGIYEIVNTINGKKYVGSAVDINRRWARHKRELRQGTHHCQHLQRAWDKNEEGTFVMHVLRIVEDKKDLIVHEQEFIDNIHPEYNTSPTAGSRLGCKSREETKRKISASHMGIRPSEDTIVKLRESHTGLSISDEQRQKMSESSKGIYRGWADKAIVQLSRDGAVVGNFKSIMDAQRATGIDNQSIVRCCKGRRPTAGGFIWRYADDVQR